VLEKKKQANCAAHGRHCGCPYRFVLKRKMMSTGVSGRVVAVPAGRIRVALEAYFPNIRLRGKGTWSQAESLHSQFVADVDVNGKYGEWLDRRNKSATSSPKTWGELVDRYVDSYAKPRREADGHELSRALKYRYDKIREWIGPTRALADLCVQDAQKLFDVLRKRRAGRAYVRSYWGSFLAIVNKAIEWNYLEKPPFNPRSAVIRSQVPRASDVPHRERRLRAGEESKLFAYLNKASTRSHRMQLVKDCTDFTLSLGWRRGTLRRLQFEDFDETEGACGVFRVPGSKMKGRRQSVKACTPLTRQIVDRRRQLFESLGVYGPKCYVFGKTTLQGSKNSDKAGVAYRENDFLGNAWRTACERAGLDRRLRNRLHFHDLRAEAACRLYEHQEGRDIRRVMAFLDHRSIEETQKYIDRFVGTEVRDNAAIMATYEVSRATISEPARTPEGTPATTHVISNG
jgi:integrase